MSTYNCTDTANNAYGAGSFGTCTGQTIGSPNTGVFEEVLSSGTFTIVAPLAAAVVLVAFAMHVIRRHKKA